MSVRPIYDDPAHYGTEIGRAELALLAAGAAFVALVIAIASRRAAARGSYANARLRHVF